MTPRNLQYTPSNARLGVTALLGPVACSKRRAGGRSPAGGHGPEGEIEIRQLFDLDEFGEGQAVDRARELEKDLAQKKE